MASLKEKCINRNFIKQFYYDDCYDIEQINWKKVILTPFVIGFLIVMILLLIGVIDPSNLHNFTCGSPHVTWDPNVVSFNR